jgi:hypothetical protein
LLGTNVTGNGETICLREPVSAGQPRRFYRAVPVVDNK